MSSKTGVFARRRFAALQSLMPAAVAAGDVLMPGRAAQNER